MCINKSFIWVQRGPGYEKIDVACRQCWRCRANRVNDYVARCMAEASTSQASLCLTLTYAPRADLADKIITPEHFQKFIRSLRDDHHLVRYLVCGEYGELRARAHFHCVLFFKHGSPLPQIPHKENHTYKHWPHGHVYADWDQDEKAIRYVCKYLLDFMPDRHWFSLSKKPPLGDQFLEQKARQAAALRVFPNSWNWLPPGGRQDRNYLLTGVSRREYLAKIKKYSAEFQTLDRSRLNEWVLKALEKLEKWQWKRDLLALPAETQNAAVQAYFDRMSELNTKSGMDNYLLYTVERFGTDIATRLLREWHTNLVGTDRASDAEAWYRRSLKRLLE